MTRLLRSTGLLQYGLYNRPTTSRNAQAQVLSAVRVCNLLLALLLATSHVRGQGVTVGVLEGAAVGETEGACVSPSLEGAAVGLSVGEAEGAGVIATGVNVSPL